MVGNSFWLPVATLWRRDLLRFWRERARVLGFVGTPFLFWLIIGSGFGDLAFFYPGALTLTVMVSAVFSMMSLIDDRREGFLLSMLVSSAPRSSMVLGKLLGSSTLAWLQALVFLCFLPLTELRAGFVPIAQAAAVLFLIAFSFTALGFFAAWKIDSSQGFHAVMNLVLFPMWMVSGALFPPGNAHGWIHALMRVNPMTYAVAALRRILDPRAGLETPGLALCVAVTLLCGLVLLIASVWVASRSGSRSPA